MKWKLTSKLFLKKNNCLLVHMSFHFSGHYSTGWTLLSFFSSFKWPSSHSFFFKRKKKERMGCWTVIKEEKKKDQLRLKSVLRDYASSIGCVPDRVNISLMEIFDLSFRTKPSNVHTRNQQHVLTHNPKVGSYLFFFPLSCHFSFHFIQLGSS